MHIHRRLLPSLLGLMALLTTSCGRTNIFEYSSATVSVSPESATLELGRSIQLTATVTSAQAATWSVEPAGVGSVTSDGIYTAPALLTSLPFEVVVRATVGDAASDTARITLVQRVTGDPAAIVIENAMGTGLAGSIAAEPLAAKVLDIDGAPLQAVRVDFALEGWAAAAVTDIDGIARIQPQLPNLVGAYTGSATIAGGLTAPFSFDVTAGPLASLSVESPEAVGHPGSLLGAPVSLRFVDAFGNSIAGASADVTTPDEASALPRAATSDIDGRIEYDVTLAPFAGLQTFRFATSTPTSVFEVSLDLNAVGGDPVVLQLLDGDDQESPARQLLLAPLRVRALDADGYPASGATIVWESPDGATFPLAENTLDLDGVSKAEVVAPTRAGLATVQCRIAASALPPVVFTIRVTPGPAQRLQLVAGNNQTAATGTAFGGAFSVRATDAFSNGVEGITVAFSALSGNGSITPASVTTDASGLAQATMTAGDEGPQQYEASATGLVGSPIVVDATAVAPDDIALEIVSGDQQSTAPNSDLTQPLVVRVTRSGVPVEGATVRFAVTLGTGTIGPSTVVTAVDGIAQATARVGNAPGTYRFSASADGAPGGPVYFDATATALPPVLFRAVSGAGQTAAVGRPLKNPLTVEVLDAAGHGVAGRTVHFVSASGAIALPVDAITDADGHASTSVTLGPAVGAQTIEAHLAGSTLPVVSFVVVAVEETSQAGRMRTTGGSGQSGELGAAVATPFEVTIAGNDGVGLAGVLVQFATSEDGASITPASVLTDGSGVARANITLGRRIGAQAFTATADGVLDSPQTLTIDAVAAPAERLVVVSGDGQTGLTNSTLALPLTVKAIDRMGNAVAGVNVMFSAGTGGGSVSTATSATDADGLASTAATLGASIGAQTFIGAASSITASRTLTVAEATVDQLEITPFAVTQPAGSGISFRATATYSDGTVQDVTTQANWSSSDTSLMTLQNAPADAGRATLLTSGSVLVQAAWKGRTASQTVTVTSAVVQTLSIAPQQLELSARDIFSFRLIATYSDGTVTDVAEHASWASSNTAVADVSNNAGTRGLVTGIAQGNATITARLGTQSATASVKINGASVTRIRVNTQGRQARCAAGTLLRLRATATYSNGDNFDVSDQASWSVANSTIAVVGQGVQGGIVQCLATGSTSVTASVDGKSDSTTVTVTAATLDSITLAPSSAQLARGDMRAFYATGNYSDGTRRDLTSLATWESGNTAIVTVSNATGQRGRAVAIDPGTTTISATLDGVSASATITVTSATLSMVVVSPANATVGTRERFVQFNATAVYSDQSTQDVTDQAAWSASDPNVGLVSSDPSSAGIVIVQGRGSCDVSATYGGKTGKTTLTVR